MSKFCQGPECHTYDTTDRKRGPKGNKVNQTRKISTYSYGNGNFCTLQCQNDWWQVNGNQAVDYIGRVVKPTVLTEDNAWCQVWNRNYYDDNYNIRPNTPRYVERNMITGEERNIINN